MELTIDDALKKGVEAHKSGQVQDADRLYTAIIKVQPKHPDANHNLGVLAVSMGKVEEALPFFKTALEVNSSITQFWLSYIDALIKLERHSDAKSICELAKQKGIRGEVFEQLKDKLNKEVSVDHKLSKNLDPPQERLQPLIDLYNQKQFQSTLDQARLLLQEFPNSFTLYNIYGVTNAGLGQLGHAIKSYKQAIKLKPDYGDAYNNMGNAQQDRGELDAAIESYKQAIKFKPDNAAAFYNMGNTLKNKGDLDAALIQYTQAIKFKPDYADAYLNMGTVQQDKGVLDDATESYKQAIEITPNYAEANYNLGVILYESRQYEKATKHFTLVNSARSQTYLLKCLYQQDKQSLFYDQLNYLISRGENNAVIGSLILRSNLKYGENIQNPFCNDPFKYILQTDLTKQCNFKNVFVKSATAILNDKKIQYKAQGHLTKGIQTAGNIFDQGSTETKKMQKIIHSELEKYRVHFSADEEGIMNCWPTKYILKGWLVSMKSGGELAAHMHESSWITGTIYINVPPKLQSDSGNLVVCIDDKDVNTDENQNKKNSINVVTGTLCLFPASLLHYTIPFKSVEERIVLAFDVIPI